MPFLLIIEMLGEVKGKRIGSLSCRGLKPPVIKGHTAAFRYWFPVFGHCDSYKETIQTHGNKRTIIPSGNPMNAPGNVYFKAMDIFSHFCIQIQGQIVRFELRKKNMLNKVRSNDFKRKQQISKFHLNQFIIAASGCNIENKAFQIYSSKQIIMGNSFILSKTNRQFYIYIYFQF